MSSDQPNKFSGTVYLAADHAGFEMKERVRPTLESLGFSVMDLGATTLDPTDDYVSYVRTAATLVAEDPATRRAIIFAGSGQGEAIVANRIHGIRAAVYYGDAHMPQTDVDGKVLDIIESVRAHNDTNVLSLGARFLTDDSALRAIQKWLAVPFSGSERHARRIAEIDE